MQIRFIIFGLLFWTYTAVSAQQSYLFPIAPGTTAQLAGTFAELRPQHFHAGIDIKTNQRVGLPVLSIDKGYVSRIIISRMGYGNAVFIKHPSGQTSVYAHLLWFNNAIAQYVEKAQLANQSFELELTPAPNALPLQRGDTLALSGNTGSSMGPHLHFEIRDAQGRNIDPLSYQFTEVQDDIPPTLEALAVRTLTGSSRIAGRFGRMEYSLASEPSPKASVRLYKLRDTLRAVGEIGLELLAYDMANGSSSHNGLSCVEVHVDGKELHYHSMQLIPEAFTDDINIHTDYATYFDTGRFFQRCYRADGNDRLPIYPAGQGRLRVAPDSVHEVTITTWDYQQNKTQLRFMIKGDLDEGVSPNGPVHWSVEENWLVVKGNAADSMTLYQAGKAITLSPVYEGCFLWDLRKGLPDSAAYGSKMLPFYFAGTAYPNQKGSITTGRSTLTFEPSTLYDTLYINLRETNGKLEIGQPTIPLKSDLLVRYQPEELPQNQEKTAIYREGVKPAFVGGKWKEGHIDFRTKSLGTYYLATDTLAPVITAERITPLELRFRIRDQLSGIKTWKAWAGAEFIILHYDEKTNQLFSRIREANRPFQGELRLEVTDNSGNQANFSLPKISSQ
ncbi:MAG: M23 family metallopeptidase [Siphonobacter sp.]